MRKGREKFKSVALLWGKSKFRQRTIHPWDVLGATSFRLTASLSSIPQTDKKQRFCKGSLPGPQL